MVLKQKAFNISPSVMNIYIFIYFQFYSKKKKKAQQRLYWKEKEKTI